MSLTERFKNAYRAFFDSGPTVPLYGAEAEKLLEWLGIDPRNTQAIEEVTYYTCLKLLSETIGKMPFKYYQMTKEGRIRAEPTKATRLLTVRPNPYMTPTTLWTTVEMNCQHYGNGYVWIRRKFEPARYGGKYEVMDIWPMQSNSVSVYMDDAGIFGDAGKIYYGYVDPKTGKSYMFQSDDVMHFKTWYSLDGVTGEPVRKILKYMIEGMNAGQEVMNNQYKQGLTAAMAMQYTGDLSDEKRKLLTKKFADALSGPKNAGKVIPVPIGLQLTPLKISMADAQFAELRKYLVNTALVRIKQYEEEVNAKFVEPWEQEKNLFYKMNEKVILRTDAKTQMETLTSAVNNGVYKPNEARDYLDLPYDPAGNRLIVNGNYIPLEMVGQQYGISQEGGN